MAQEIGNLQKLIEKVRALFATEIIEIKEFRGQTAILINKQNAKKIIKYLKEQEGFNHLQDLCGVDYYPEKPRFEVVYNLYSIWRKMHLRVRVKVHEEDPEIDTITDLWQGANWHERECYDMFGISFKGHADLRRILMPEDWNGHPLRKDYPLKGKEIWSGFRQLFNQNYLDDGGY